jgi:metal-responsive CopG/Arc/MetJ family transcriptional regulator
MVPIAFRYPEDRVDLLDAIVKRRGDGDRSATIRAAVDSLIEQYFPGSTVQPEPATIEGDGA